MGYRHDDVGDMLPDALALDQEVMDPRFVPAPRKDYVEQVVAHTVGPFLREAPVIPDTRYPQNLIEGFGMRVANEKLAPKQGRGIDFMGFSHEFTADAVAVYDLQPIDHMPTVDEMLEYIDTKPLPTSRKDQLREAVRLCDGNWEILYVRDDYTRNETHGKKEILAKYKLLRSINSRHDVAKMIFGLLIEWIEHQVYRKMPFFVKGLSMETRWRVIMERLEGAELLGTNDYTRFESLIYGHISEAEACLFSYMFSQLEPSFVSTFLEIVCGVQTCRNRDGFRGEARARMSGDMHTSLGNGWTNLTIWAYVFNSLGWYNGPASLKLIVEGDDSVVSLPGTASKSDIERVLDELGLRAKLEIYESLGVAGFLSTYSWVDGEPLVDFRPQVIKLGWSLSELAAHERFRSGLFRAKCLSTACLCPGCPVVRSLVRMGLRLTSNTKPIYDERHSKWWLDDVVGTDRPSDIPEAVFVRFTEPIPLGRRTFYATLFNITVAEQLKLEEYFDGVSACGLMECSLLDSFLTEYDHQRHYFVNYTRRC